MPQYSSSVQIAVPPPDLFDFLARPANLLGLAPPELRLQLVEGPERLHHGATVHWKAWRAGVSQSLVNEVTAFEDGTLIVEEQKRGPFGAWVLSRRVEPAGAGTRLVEKVQFEPPTGVLGLLVGAATIQRELERMFAFREQRLKELFGGV